MRITASIVPRDVSAHNIAWLCSWAAAVSLQTCSFLANAKSPVAESAQRSPKRYSSQRRSLTRKPHQNGKQDVDPEVLVASWAVDEDAKGR